MKSFGDLNTKSKAYVIFLFVIIIFGFFLFLYEIKNHKNPELINVSCGFNSKVFNLSDKQSQLQYKIKYCNLVDYRDYVGLIQYEPTK